MCLAGAGAGCLPGLCPGWRLCGLERHKRCCSTRKEPEGWVKSCWNTMRTAVILMPEPSSPSPSEAFRLPQSVHWSVWQPVVCPAGNVPTLNDDKDTLTITTTVEASGMASIRLEQRQSGCIDSGCGRRDYGHHLDHGPFRFDPHRPGETRNRQCSGGRGQGRSDR